MIPVARIRPIVGVLMVALALLSARARGANPMMVDGARPQRVIVLLPGTEWDEGLADLPEMPRRLSGVLAVLEADGVRALFESISRARPDKDAAQSEPMFELLLEGRSSGARATIAASDGDLLALVGADGGAVVLDRAEFLACLGTTALYRGGFGKPNGESAKVVAFTGTPERIDTLDSRTVRSRLSRTGGGGSSSLARHDGEFASRLPKGFDPENPPGLIVWCSPTDPWAVPEQLHSALDEHNLIAIGALDAGNERPVLDRVQLALDATATALSTWPIDARRVYVVGMSGGAKIAVMLWAGWPELYSGAVPIVGMASYRSEPAPNGGLYPPLISKPAPAAFRQLTEHRLAPMTGPPDFNYDSVVKMAKGLDRDGLAVRVFEYAEMAHTMPTPARFDEAIRWVDETYQVKRRAEIAAAAKALTQAEAGDRDALLEVMRLGPWTPAAWKAWDRFKSLPRDRPAP